MNPTTDPIRIAVTGGPGAGKTSMLAVLRQRGYTIIPEVARSIIADRVNRGLSPRPEPVDFANLIFDRDIEQFEATRSATGVLFFDRSAIDSLGMLDEVGQLTTEKKQRVLSNFPYYPTALILPPWREIYHNDAQRDQTYDDSIRIFGAICHWYVDCGYSIVEVPKMSIDDRCDFVRQFLASQGIKPRC